MEYVEGTTLCQLLARRKIEMKRALGAGDLPARAGSAILLLEKIEA